MAGFQVTFNGRFCVTAEENASRDEKTHTLSLERGSFEKEDLTHAYDFDTVRRVYLAV